MNVFQLGQSLAYQVDEVIENKSRKTRNGNKDLTLRIIAGFFAAFVIFPYAIPKFRKWVVLGPKEKYKNVQKNKVAFQAVGMGSSQISGDQLDALKITTKTHKLKLHPHFPMESLPEELAFFVFSELKTELPNLALVCRKWQVIADSEKLYKMIFPYRIAFTPEDWRDNLGVDAGIASRLPRRVHGDLEKGDHLLTWIPGTIRCIYKDRIGQKGQLDAELTKELTKEPKKGYPIAFDLFSCQEIIKREISPKKSRWVWIDREVKWRNKTPQEQEKLTKKQGQGAGIAGSEELAISLLVKYNKSNEPCFIWKKNINGHRTLIRVKDQINGKRFVCTFKKYGLRFFGDSGKPHQNVGVVVTRSSIGF